MVKTNSFIGQVKLQYVFHKWDYPFNDVQQARLVYNIIGIDGDQQYHGQYY